MGRAPCCEKVGLKKGRWTTEEDEILTKYIQTNGEGSWRSLPMKAGLLRCGKSCRLRWINYLRGDLKRGNITPEEEEVIIKLHSSYGNRWSLIAGHLPGRTDNEIKNYWNSHLSRRIHTVRRLNHDGVPVVLDIGKFVGGPKRRGGRTRRSAAFHKRTAQKTDQAPTSTTTAKPNQPQKPGSGPTHNNVVVFSDVEKDSSLSGLSHDDFDNEMLCSDVMDPGAFWSSNEPTEISRHLSPPRGQRRETEEAAGAASDLSSDAFDDGIFGANYEVSDSAIWGSHRDKEDDLFTFGYEGLNDMVLCPNQVNEGGLWSSGDESGTRFFASSKSGDAILQGDDNVPCLSYDLLENEFFRFNEVADSVFWGSSGGAESDANMGFESTGLILSPSDLMESELLPTPEQNEQGRRRCEEDVENGSQGKVNVGCSGTTATTDLVLKSGEDHKRDNEWSSSGLMADWSWEGFEDKFREMEGGDVWPWLLGSSTADHYGGGGLGFEDELNKSYAAWVFPAETNVNL